MLSICRTHMHLEVPIFPASIWVQVNSNWADCCLSFLLAVGFCLLFLFGFFLENTMFEKDLECEEVCETRSSNIGSLSILMSEGLLHTEFLHYECTQSNKQKLYVWLFMIRDYSGDSSMCSPSGLAYSFLILMETICIEQMGQTMLITWKRLCKAFVITEFQFSGFHLGMVF